MTRTNHNSPIPAVAAPRAGGAAEPRCPKCGGDVRRVRNTAGWMNDEQFDSVKAGDWYCETCPDPTTRSGYSYFSDEAVRPSPVGATSAPASEPTTEPECANCLRDDRPGGMIQTADGSWRCLRDCERASRPVPASKPTIEAATHFPPYCGGCGCVEGESICSYHAVSQEADALRTRLASQASALAAAEQEMERRSAVHLRRHQRLADALGMDPGYSVDATVNKAIEVIRAARLAPPAGGTGGATA